MVPLNNLFSMTAAVAVTAVWDLPLLLLFDLVVTLIPLDMLPCDLSLPAKIDTRSSLVVSLLAEFMPFLYTSVWPFVCFATDSKLWHFCSSPLESIAAVVGVAFSPIHLSRSYRNVRIMKSSI